jgi:hypothetical protein
MREPAQTDKDFHGVSLSSLLQMLEQEQVSCTLSVSDGQRSGKFFFHKGQLIDASYEDKAGLEAVYALLVLEDPSFHVIAAEDRMVRIKQPLARILLHTGSGQEEQNNEGIEARHNNPQLEQLLADILASPEIKHYYLLNRKGQVLARSSDNNHICNFISYALMSALQIKKNLGTEVKGPQNIHVVLETDEVLLLLPGAGMIIGLLLSGEAAIPHIVRTIRASLSSRKKEST